LTGRTAGTWATGGLLAILSTLAVMGVFDKSRLTEAEKWEVRADVTSQVLDNLSPLRVVDSTYLYNLGSISINTLEDGGALEFGWTVKDSIFWQDPDGHYNSRVITLREPAIATWGIFNRGEFSSSPLPISTTHP
jgi:hypothetical protein